MSKKNKNVFEKAEELLEKVAGELEMANNLLYVCASELVEQGEKIAELSAKVEKLLSEPVKVTFDLEALKQTVEKQTPKPEQATMPKIVFKPPYEKGE